MKLDRLVTLAAACAAPVLTIAVVHGWLSKTDAEQIGLIVAVAVGGYHVPNDKARTATAVPVNTAGSTYVSDL